MALEHFKTQVLLLHSQQRTLDVLSAGFNDRYTVHVATSGAEALSTLTETPIHVIVSAQDLPGMSGLDALREAKKRSPETIGILLAGSDADDGLEALVGDKEVFEIVRGEISPGDLKALIDNATRRVRLLALSESANDQAANPDEPIGEHIVMETSENGSTIISDGTGRMPALKPEKVAIIPNVGGNQVDVLVLTKDEEFLATIRDSARGLHNIHHANTPRQAEEFTKRHQIGVLVTDAAMVGSNIESVTQNLRKSIPRLVAVVAGRRDDGEMLMDLINRGQVYRFLLKPVSPGRARLAIEASVKHHLEADDAAFKAKEKSQDQAPKARLRAKAIPQAKAKPQPKPQSEAKPQTEAKPQAKAKPKAKPKPTAAAKTRDKPRRIAPTIGASPDIDSLSDTFPEDTGFSQTMTDIANTVGKSLPGASESLAGARSAIKSSGDKVGGMLGGVTAPLRKPKNLAIAASLLAVVGLGYWFAANRDASTPPAEPPEATAGVPTIVEAEVPVREPEAQIVEEPAISAVDEILDEARRARGSGYIYTPPGNNAVELYVAALSTEPDNPVVAAELEDIVDQTLGMIEKALLEQRTDDASEALQMVRLADPKNSRLVFLDAQVKQMQLRNALDQARVAIRSGRFEDAGNFIGVAEALNTGDATEIETLKQELATARSAQQVDEVLGLANERLDENKLITPSNDNARYYYELALSNDPDNPAARQGMTIIASKLVLRAREAMDNDLFDQAGSLLQDAEALDPDSSELAASKSALDQAIRQQEVELQVAAQRQAEAEKLAEAERRAEAERLAALERQAELERELEAQRQSEAAKRAELERQLTAQVEAEAKKRADLERQLAAQAETEAEKRAELERQLELQKKLEADKRAQMARELEAQRQAEIEKRAALEEELAARKTADQKRESAALAAAAVAATNAKTRVTQTRRSTTTRSPATTSSRTVSQPAKPEPEAATVTPTAQTAAVSQLPVQRLSPPVERTIVPMSNPAATTQGAAAAPLTETPPAEPARVAIGELKRTNYVAPKYPRSAQRRNTSGWVDLGFTVARDGSVHSIEIIESTPGSVFDESATKAVSQWRFEPVVENGEPVEKRVAVRMMFSLE